MNDTRFTTHRTETLRHRTAWLEAGPSDGPLMLFVHGWPEIGLVWKAQMRYFAERGWRCIAPDMRGYGGSSVPTKTSDYAVREAVTDMIELHDVLGGSPAVWVGHDWGSPVVWAMASHYGQRCRGVVNLCVPYLARGMALPNLVPLIDRTLYPIERYPIGQWDYFLFHRENFSQSARDLEADTKATLATLYRRGTPEAVGKPSFTADIRKRGGWFGSLHHAPPITTTAPDAMLLSPPDFEAMVAAFQATGFHGADAWYLNDEANLAYAGEAPNFGSLTLPVLFVHAAWDTVCETVHSKLADPMRADCGDLTEVTLECGHEVMLETPDQLNSALQVWLEAKRLKF